MTPIHFTRRCGDRSSSNRCGQVDVQHCRGARGTCSSQRGDSDTGTETRGRCPLQSAWLPVIATKPLLSLLTAPGCRLEGRALPSVP